MAIFRADAEDDRMYLYADDEEEAYQKLSRIVGFMPRSIVTFKEVDREDVEPEEEIL